MAIKAVFFDAAGTLIQPARAVGETYTRFAEKYGVRATPADISERFRICFDAAPRLAFPDASESVVGKLERQWWLDLVDRIFQPWNPIPRFDDFFDELFAYYARPDSWTLYPEVPETLAALAERKLVLGVISNFDSRLNGILRGLGIGSSFNEIFVSSRVGYAKPDRQIFTAALARYSLEPSEGLHVGDSEVNDLQGAKEAGLRALLIDRRNQHEQADRVASLRSILDLVGTATK